MAREPHHAESDRHKEHAAQQGAEKTQPAGDQPQPDAKASATAAAAKPAQHEQRAGKGGAPRPTFSRPYGSEPQNVDLKTGALTSGVVEVPPTEAAKPDAQRAGDR